MKNILSSLGLAVLLMSVPQFSNASGDTIRAQEEIVEDTNATIIEEQEEISNEDTNTTNVEEIEEISNEEKNIQEPVEEVEIIEENINN